MPEPLGIALIGCGVVGSGVAKLLLEEPKRLAERAGRPLVLRRVVVRDPAKERGVNLPRELLSTDSTPLYRDPEIDIAVELIGGLEPAGSIILKLLQSGKDVVTANKLLLAERGTELFRMAHECGRTIAFEGSVAGGIPIIAAVGEGLAANQIRSIKAILNGTSNFILTEMTENGVSYAQALAEAQRLGYAEADPTLDVDGSDAAHKLAILARLAFGVAAPMNRIERRGIADIQQCDIRYAGELGYVIKLLAEGWLSEHQLAMHVEPTLLRRLDPLAQVRGAYNAVHVVGDAVGDTLYYGKGAGQMPTASAVVADLIDLALGRAQKTFNALKLWTTQPGIAFRSTDTIRSRFYLRMNVEDRPGVLAEVAGILGRHQISIASLVQHEPLEEHEGLIVPLVIRTHDAGIANLKRALAEIDQLGCVSPPSTYFPVAE
jgi:homoserine dehydrogenase